MRFQDATPRMLALYRSAQGARGRAADLIEMSCVAECFWMPQLLRAVAIRSRLASPAEQDCPNPLGSDQSCNHCGRRVRLRRRLGQADKSGIGAVRGQYEPIHE